MLLLGLAIVQVAGLTIHALDRIDLQRLAQARDVAVRVVSTYRMVMTTPPERRQEVLSQLRSPARPDRRTRRRAAGRRSCRAMPVPFGQRLHARQPQHGAADGRAALARAARSPPSRTGTSLIAMHLPDGDWLNLSVPIEPPRAWHSPTFLAAFLLMTVTAAGLTLWAVRRLTAPVRTLAAAAEALGRDVNAPPLPEGGPVEVATAAVAFNTMAARIRRFVEDRTELLTAIGHDLRTPITRLKLRAEFVEDDEQRGKMLADLEELEAMVSATLAFGRDARTTEPVVVAGSGGAAAHGAGRDRRRPARCRRTGCAYHGPPHLTVRARPLALKRALTNLVANAVIYGGCARVRPDRRRGRRWWSIEVEDDGPGIPPGELERVFEPFYRGEPSRNRETGGVGLGLPIARNILRAHGGDVALANRPLPADRGRLQRCQGDRDTAGVKRGAAASRVHQL